MYNIALALGIPLVLLVLVGVQINAYNRKQKAMPPATPKQNRG
jgi:hypothetical protein